MIRALLLAALVLAFVVLAASSGLRLAANGLSCARWPACYGQPATAEAQGDAASTAALRAVHRVTATVFGLLALAIPLAGWRRFTRGERTAALLLLIVTVGLAWLGRHTPSPLPAVTLANVLGGLTLIGLLAWLLARDSGRVRIAVVGAFALALALQAVGGALISARLAGAACVPACEHAWRPGVGALWNPARAGSAEALLGDPKAGQPLVATHALAGIALLLAAIGIGAVHGGSRAARRFSMTAGAAAAAGLALYVFDSPLWLAVLHAALAGALVAALAALAAGGKASLESA